VIKSEETIAIEFERRMRELASTTQADALLLQMNPRVSAEFTANEARVLQVIEGDTGKWFHFEGSEGLPLEHFAVLLEGDREQVLQRALPFREGEEVHVEIVEPHMYSPGDAVAKIDGYIISVKDAESAVGDKRLVRIVEVGRTSASAVLIDTPALEAVAVTETVAAAAHASEDDAQDSARRRGRRGGRRRAAPKAPVTASAPEPEAPAETA
jgi:ribonuclease G